ncbi:thiamine pyrophosphate-dependent dehydrogenase E1 component subunit alpha [Hydrogenimonas thermophila]|uniref:Pyruvate dehydrogenase E1 component alpha subunit n=1 Tax=Hydrogenimonas thermophila TaxID=223786 RepID=A0A1I5QIA6_9BACT|nr:thiamine pyrophosphate-dependent enzyme [Hydrogenimonas thermophila]SFP45963.1 pyruvate dehydrogenase E1 component alpha subunit [Hydrogenimonas thermophila]
MNKLLAEEIYYLMVLGRKFEFAAKEHYMQGNISGFLHLDIGQEALSVSAMKAFDRGDIFSGYRVHVMAIARGLSAKSVMAELFGKVTGVSRGKGGSMHLYDPSHFFYGGDAIVGEHIPNAVGCAYARKYQGSQEAVMVIFGDGATNCGAFFESLNIASAQNLPLLFLCENNGYAIGTKITSVAPFLKQSKKAEPYMRTVEVDGMDAVAVYETLKEAQKSIYNGHGPIFVEAFTCRFEGHSMSDPGSYRTQLEMQVCKSKDPIERMKRVLKDNYLVDDSYIETLEKRAQEAVEEAVEFALSSPEPEIEELYKNVFCQSCANVIS